MSAARIEKLESLLARVQRNRHAAPAEPRRKPSTPLELAVESAELPLPSEPPPAPPAIVEHGTPPAGVKVTPSFAKVAIPVDDEPELVVSEPSGDYDVVIDGDDDGDELPTVPPPPPEPPAVVIASPGFEPVQLPPLPPSERPPAIEALPLAALVEPTPAAKTPVAEPAVAKAPPIAEAPPVEAPRPVPAARPIEASLPAASAPVARVVAPAPKPEPSTFGELLDRALALRPR
jgi:hypothetical protein